MERIIKLRVWEREKSQLFCTTWSTDFGIILLDLDLWIWGLSRVISCDYASMSTYLGQHLWFSRLIRCQRSRKLYIFYYLHERGQASLLVKWARGPRSSSSSSRGQVGEWLSLSLFLSFQAAKSSRNFGAAAGRDKSLSIYLSAAEQYRASYIII